jgi:hypothetical protein
VTLSGLSFPNSATSFHIYRGPNPSELFRIASNVVLSDQFNDTGLDAQAILPPDPNFDHVNLYWRLELQPETNATIQSASTIGNGSLQMSANAYRGATVRIARGMGAAQERNVIANDATILTIDSPWDLAPDSTSYFVVAQSGYQFGATSKGNQAEFPIPNRPGAVIEISGRSANSSNVECPYGISPLTRWQIGETGVGSEDMAVPAEPFFGLSLSTSQGGTVQLGAIGFSDLSNTKTISAGTYTFHYYDELAGPPTLLVGTPIVETDTSIALTAVSGAVANSLVQLEQEVLQVTAVSPDGLTLQVSRGLHGTVPVPHLAGTLAYSLASRVLIVPFIRNFFGSPSSGDWTYSLPFPNVRIASAELFVTNAQGNSPTASGAFTNNLDYGMRTLSGGQYSFQIAGFLAVQTGAVPDISAEGPHAIRDIFAFVKTAPTDSAIALNINRNGNLLGTLSIPAGLTASSNAVTGLLLPALKTGDRLSLDITTVGQTIPGSDLTVVIRV